jgi:hypothetical protein
MQRGEARHYKVRYDGCFSSLLFSSIRSRYDRPLSSNIASTKTVTPPTVVFVGLCSIGKTMYTRCERGSEECDGAQLSAECIIIVIYSLRCGSLSTKFQRIFQVVRLPNHRSKTPSAELLSTEQVMSVARMSATLMDLCHLGPSRVPRP